MPRKKCYGSEAEKQRAYRLRKAGLVLVEKEEVIEPESREKDEVSPNNLPVPVLAEPRRLTDGPLKPDSEARESTKPNDVATTSGSDSRGGQNLSKTDQKFDLDRPGWYILGKEVKERNCWKCGEYFKTRLEMNKFCSPKCKNDYLDTAFTKLRQ